MAMRQDASTGKMVEVPDTGTDKQSTGKVPTMKIKVYAPFKIFYEGEGTSISGFNETGQFDILPQHHNFLCTLLPGDITIRTEFDEQVIKISRAIMHVNSGEVTVFVDV